MSIRLGTIFLAGTPDITGKANIDADNFSNTGKSTIAGLGMPSGTYENLTLLASGQTYTAPANGWFYFGINASVTGATIDIGGNGMDVTQIAHASGNQLRRIFPAKKGDSITISYSGSAASIFRFVYAEGSESEAS